MEIDFVGRTQLLALLMDRAESASHGTATRALVVGAGGSGKSSLLREFQNRIPAFDVIRASGDENESMLPFSLLDLIFQQLPGRDQAAQPEPRDALVEGAQLLASVAQGPRPVALLIDDAHLADGPSMTALTFAARRFANERVLLVLTSRPEGVRRLPIGFQRLLADHHVQLDGLTTAEIRQLAVLIGIGRITERAAARLREHTGGSPLYLQALFADLTAAQIESSRPLPAPQSFALQVVESLAQRSASTQRLAAAAAVLGLECQLLHAIQLAGVEDVPCTVEELERAHIARLAEHDDGRRLLFEHPLVRAAVYDHLGPADRAQLHRQAAALCSGVESLRHRVAATLGSDDSLVEELRRYAADARSQFAWRRAAELLLSAVRVCSPGEARNSLLLETVGLFLLDGDLATAATFSDAVAEVPESAFRLQVQAQVAWLTGQHEHAYTFAERAWAAAGDLNPSTRDDVAAMLSQMCIMRNDGAGAAEWARRAVDSGLLSPESEYATRNTGAVGLAMTGRIDEAFAFIESSVAPGEGTYNRNLAARGMLELWDDNLTAATAHLREGIGPYVPGGSTEPYRLVGMTYLAEAEYRSGDWDTSRAVVEQAISLVEDTGQIWLAAFVNAVSVLVPAARGEFDDADRRLTLAQKAADELGDPPSRAYADNAAVHLAGCRGDAEGVVLAANWLRNESGGPPLEPGFFGWSVHYVTALISLHRLDEADSTLAELEAVAHARGRNPRLAALSRLRGELESARRNPAPARAAFERALAYAAGGTDALEAGLLDAAYGRFLRRRGERKAALQRLQSARAIFERLDAAPFLARCDAEIAAAGTSRAALPDPNVIKNLTPQESAVARLVSAGHTNRQISEELTISVKTVGYHLGNAYAKLGITSRTQLVALLAREVTATNADQRRDRQRAVIRPTNGG